MAALARDPLLDISANLALLAAARRVGGSGRDAEATVLAALEAMEPGQRALAAAALRRTQERMYEILRRLAEGSPDAPIGADDVRAAIAG